MRTLKRSLDPQWLMNPGKIFDAVAGEKVQSPHEMTAASTLERPKDK
jgi:hypothetical protein